MADTLERHPFFESWTDPVSGVRSFLLSRHVAPVQQSFYFLTPSLSGDQRWLWFYAAFPPSPQRMLAAVSLDADDPRIHLFPASQFSASSPLVAPEGDAAYFCSGPSVWRQPLAGEPERVCTLPAEMRADVADRLRRLATHLTISADGRYFLLDGQIGAHWFLALGERASGQVRLLKTFGRHYNHAQFSPVDPELFMIAQDWWVDPVSLERFDFDQRIWLMDSAQTRFEPLRPTEWFGRGKQPCHEFWSADGLACWTDYAEGAYECDLATRQVRQVWSGPLCHAHCDATRRFWCADQSPYRWPKEPCQVLFFDRSTARQVAIVSAMPAPPLLRRSYHLDPHPQVSPQGNLVVYTSCVRGRVEVALARVEEILERM